MNNLNGATTYLIGPIDALADDGVAWRERITPCLKAMNITVFNPCNKPCEMGQEIGGEKDRLMTLKEAEDWGSLRESMKPIVHADLRMVQKSDFVIACLPKNIPVCGTIYEIAIAITCKIPVLILCPDGRKTVPNWMFGVTHYNYMHETQDSLMEYIQNVDSGVATIDKSKWQFFNWDLLEEKKVY